MAVITDDPPIRENIPPVEDRGIFLIDPNILIDRLWAVIMVWWLVGSTVDQQVGGLNLPCARALWLSTLTPLPPPPPPPPPWSMTG